MTINRDSLIEKIRALMSKTINNGCTEHEALAALDKARAMMDAYEVTEADLQLTKAESAILRSEPPGSRDPHGIKFGLSAAVSKFCDCEIWRAPCGLEICGLPADVRFATWLLDTLAAFVQAELARHLMGSPPQTRSAGSSAPKAFKSKASPVRVVAGVVTRGRR